jgi:hypothetical protein
MSKFDVLSFHYRDGNHALTTEENGTVTLCVTNTGDTDFVFSNAQMLGVDQIPGIDAVPDEAAKADVIYFYYDYSDADKSLTNENYRDSIAVSSTDTQFSVAASEDLTVQRYFKIFSAGKSAVIPANSMITFSVNATCSKTPGEAVTIFKYSDDEKDLPPRKCFDINKYPKPVIDMFEIDGTGYNENDPVTFRWTVNHIEEFDVQLNEIPVSAGHTWYGLNIACRDYTLYVRNKAGYVSSKTLSPDFGIIFETEKVESQSSITLRWDVSRLYKPEVKITRSDTGDSKIFREKSGTVVFGTITVDVVFRLDCKMYDKEISVTYPKIIEFEVSRTPFLSGRECIPPEEVAKNKCSVVGSLYDGPGPIPISKIYVKWKIIGDYCTVNATKFPDREGRCTIDVKKSVEFRAYINCGLYVSQTKNI